MKTVICIMGKTFSGKTTLVNRLKKEGELDFIISHTTRPPRSDERNGVDYYFENNVAENGLIKREYTPSKLFSSKNWVYWVDGNDIEKYKHPILVTDYKGFRQLKKALPQYRVLALYLDVSLSTIFKRIINTVNSEKRLHEAVRRLYSDELEYNDINSIVVNKSNGLEFHIKDGVVLLHEENVSHISSTALLNM